MLCPSIKVIRSDSKYFSSYSEGYTKTSCAPLYKQWHRPISKRFTKPPFSILSTRIAVAYPRPGLSATKRTYHAPISLDQEAQVSQGHTSCRNKNKCNIEVHGGGGLELVKLARESASSLPKPCASLKNAPDILPFAAPCWPS